MNLTPCMFISSHHNGGSVVRSSVLTLRLDLLKKIVPSVLWLKALVHHAALTAYHEDRRAEGFPEEAHGLSRNAGHPMARRKAGPLFVAEIRYVHC